MARRVAPLAEFALADALGEELAGRGAEHARRLPHDLAGLIPGTLVADDSARYYPLSLITETAAKKLLVQKFKFDALKINKSIFVPRKLINLMDAF